ncbi:hypothetical protein AAMO2058_001623100 [Amorphochlora amoebiformis]
MGPDKLARHMQHPAKRLSPQLTTPKCKSIASSRSMKARIHTNKGSGKAAKVQKNVKWTAEDDERLRRAVRMYDEKNWKAIAQEGFGGKKSDVQCLHRWRKVLDPSIKKGPWTAQEDKLIMLGIQTYGEGKWSDIAKKIQGRLGKQCRERWMNHLDPSIRKDPFTAEEDNKIIELHAVYGTQWTRIRKDLPGRTDNAIKNRFYSHLRRRVVATNQNSSHKRFTPKPHRPKKPKSSRKRKSSSYVPPAPEQVPSEVYKAIHDRAASPSRPKTVRAITIEDTPASTTLATTRIPNHPGIPENFAPTPRAVKQYSISKNLSPALKTQGNSGRERKSTNAFLTVSPAKEVSLRGSRNSPHFSSSSVNLPLPSPQGEKYPTCLSFTSPPPLAPLEINVFASPGPRTPDYRRIMHTTLSSPCPRLTPLREGKNLMDMMDAAEEHIVDNRPDLEKDFSHAR